MHGIVCGPTGSGKSSGVFVPNLIERTGVSAIVTEATAGDEQLDLFKKTAGFRQLAGQKIYKFSPGDLTSHRINPLQRVKTFDQAAQMASLIIRNTSNKPSFSDQIWETSETQLLTVLILHAISEKTHLGSIREWLCLGADGLAKMLLKSQFVKVRSEYEGFYNTSSEGFRNGVLSGLRQRLNLWVSPQIVALTETTDIDLENLPNELFTFYLSVSAHEERLKPLAALIFNFLLGLTLEMRFKHPLALFLALCVVVYAFFSTDVPKNIIDAGSAIWWTVLLVWIAWFVIMIQSKEATERENLLAPPWKKYACSCQIVFKKVKTVLKEASYGYGDEWRITTASTQNNKIVATLRPSDDASEGKPRKCFIKLTAQIDIADGGKSSILKLTFDEKSDGREAESYEIIREVTESIDNSLGGGEALTIPLVFQIQHRPEFPVILVALGLGLVGLQNIYSSVHQFNYWITHGFAAAQTEAVNESGQERYVDATFLEYGR